MQPATTEESRPALKGFETRSRRMLGCRAGPEESRPALKGFETCLISGGVGACAQPEESRPALKGFETLTQLWQNQLLE